MRVLLVSLAWVLVVLTAIPRAGVSADSPIHRADPAYRGELLHQKRGCLGCHSVDGSVLIGPPHNESWRASRKFADDREATATRAYLRESIREPVKKIVMGFPHVMPQQPNLADKEVEWLSVYIASLRLSTLEGEQLETALKDYAKEEHAPLTYREARERMYWVIDREGDGVRTVYGGEVVPLDVNEWPDQLVLNCEHLWPRSRGGYDNGAREDLYHMRPSIPALNNRRGNLPFGTPVNAGDDLMTGREVDGDQVLLPPYDERGDIARSMFYIALRYELEIGDDEEEDLRRWHEDDPVDVRELDRAELIREAQGNRNPFIDMPELVNRIEDF